MNRLSPRFAAVVSVASVWSCLLARAVKGNTLLFEMSGDKKRELGPTQKRSSARAFRHSSASISWAI